MVQNDMAGASSYFLQQPTRRPPGRPPKIPKEYPLTGLQDPGARAKTLVEKHGAQSILRALRDEKYLCDNFSTYDGMLIMGLGHALKGSGDERERMFNRMFGKVPDKQISLNVNIDIRADALSGRAKALLERITTEEN